VSDQYPTRSAPAPGDEAGRREAWGLAGELCAHVLACLSSLEASSPDFAAAAAAVPFVPVRGPRDPAAAADAPPPEALARFRDAAAAEDEPLVWVAMPVLARARPPAQLSRAMIVAEDAELTCRSSGPPRCRCSCA
jgi:hypothetical protein